MPERFVGPIVAPFESAATVAEVRDALGRELRDLGFVHFACCSHVDPVKPPRGAVMLTNFPEAWLNHYSQRAYPKLDPVLVRARREALPFPWTDPRFRARCDEGQMRILAEAAEHGLVNGLTFPLHVPGARPACCSLVFGDEAPREDAGFKAYALAIAAHEAARDIILSDDTEILMRLRKREREVMDLVGRGKDEASIGDMLGISTSTAHFHMRRVMGKYQLSTRVQVVVRAIADGLFHAWDLLE